MPARDLIPEEAPPYREERTSVARLEYELISANPYGLTQEDVQFAVHLQRQDMAETQAGAKSPWWAAKARNTPNCCVRLPSSSWRR